MLRISENKATACRPANTPGGFSLIELLIVLAVLGIVTGAALTHLQSAVHDQLDAAAQVVASDLNYVRNLSVANNTSYRFSFTPGTAKYYFEHSGGNAALDTLPASPHGERSDSPTRQRTDLAMVSLNAADVQVVAVFALTPTRLNSNELEFGPLGETTRSQETEIWLSAGAGDAKRFLPLVVNPVTGNTKIGDQQLQVPLGSGDGGPSAPTSSPTEAPPL